MVQKIHPWGVIWVPSSSPRDVHLNWNSGARSLSSSKACPWVSILVNALVQTEVPWYFLKCTIFFASQRVKLGSHNIKCWMLFLYHKDIGDKWIILNQPLRNLFYNLVLLLLLWSSGLAQCAMLSGKLIGPQSNASDINMARCYFVQVFSGFVPILAQVEVMSHFGKSSSLYKFF